MYQLVPVNFDTGTIGLQAGLTDIGRETLGELGAEVLETIHRSQHAQVRLEGSRVLLTRLGSNPTGVRSRGAEWQWLAKDQTVELADDMELAFSKSKRLIAQSTFVLRRTPTVGSEGASKSEPSGQPERGVEAAPAPVNKRPPAGETQEPCKQPKEGPPRGAFVIELSDGEDEPMPDRQAQIDADGKLARQLQDEQMARDERRYPSSWPVAASGSERQRLAPLQPRAILERIRDGWISWDGVEPLSDWLDEVRPSRVPAQSCAWVAVDNREPRSRGYGKQQWNGSFDEEPYLEALRKIEAVIESGKGVSAKAKQECVDSLLETAKRQGLTSGKWMAFVMPGVADAVWADVARATAEGELGSFAKVSPTLGSKPEKTAYCGAYVHDFRDRAELKRVLLAFRKLMQKHGVEVKAGFKPDVFTHLGITKGKQQQERASPSNRFPQARQRLAAEHTTVYRVDEVLHNKWDESQIMYRCSGGPHTPYTLT